MWYVSMYSKMLFVDKVNAVQKRKRTKIWIFQFQEQKFDAISAFDLRMISVVMTYTIGKTIKFLCIHSLNHLKINDSDTTALTRLTLNPQTQIKRKKF